MVQGVHSKDYDLFNVFIGICHNLRKGGRSINVIEDRCMRII